MKDLLPTNIFGILDKAGICTSKQILLLSFWDIQKLSNLREDDIRLVKNIVANSIIPLTVTGKEIVESFNKISTGCTDIDNLLKGGFRRGTIAELFGESGSGKTQIALQTAVHNAINGCVYICTEELFPVKRFDQIYKFVHGFDMEAAKRIFVEHLTEPQELLACIRVRLPKLLSCNSIALIVLDSIAAPFRCESAYDERAEELKEVAMLLLKTAQNYNISVICINQVTAAFTNMNDVLPSLGLIWSNMISYRYHIKKNKSNDDIENNRHEMNIRQLQVVNSPDLANDMVEFMITADGVKNISF